MENQDSVMGVFLFRNEFNKPLGDETTTNEGIYKISSSSEHSEHKRYYLFDRNFGTRFETNGTPDGWIQVELPVAKVVNYYQVGARSDSWCSAAPRKI